MLARYQVFLTPQSRTMLEDISDRRVRSKIEERIDGLQTEPDKQGKALGSELTGYRSLRAVGQRYRIIYQVIHHKVEVHVVALGQRSEGSRRDVYELARKLFRMRLLT